MAKRGNAGKGPDIVPLPAEGQKGVEAATGMADEESQFRLINHVAQALWLPSDMSERLRQDHIQAAVKMLEAIRPGDGLEGMLAAQMVATHHAAMECLRRSMQEQRPHVGREHELKLAARLLATFARQLETLNKHRGKGQQKVTVEHVHVNEGGQAIVGHVEHPGWHKEAKPKKAKGKTAEPKTAKRNQASIPHDPGDTFEFAVEKPRPVEAVELDVPDKSGDGEDR